MAKVTVAFGVVLVLVGIAGFVLSGSHAPTALIPSYIGVVLAVCGVVAMTDDLKRRGLAMHIAATVGLLGFLATAKSMYDVMRLAQGAELPRPIAIEEKAATSLLCLLFVLFCVRSFIAARRARLGA